jgi:hypothetical protein
LWRRREEEGRAEEESMINVPWKVERGARSRSLKVKMQEMKKPPPFLQIGAELPMEHRLKIVAVVSYWNSICMR